MYRCSTQYRVVPWLSWTASVGVPPGFNPWTATASAAPAAYAVSVVTTGLLSRMWFEAVDVTACFFSYVSACVHHIAKMQ